MPRRDNATANADRLQKVFNARSSSANGLMFDLSLVCRAIFLRRVRASIRVRHTTMLKIRTTVVLGIQAKTEPVYQ
jgi:hypothetical protein